MLRSGSPPLHLRARRWGHHPRFTCAKFMFEEVDEILILILILIFTFEEVDEAWFYDQSGQDCQKRAYVEFDRGSAPQRSGAASQSMHERSLRAGGASLRQRV